MAGLKEYFYKSREESISFQTADNNNIDSEKYTLFEILQDEKLELLKIEERIDILNSWLKDNNRKYTATDRRIVENGCQQVVRVRNTVTDQDQDLLNFSSNDYLKLTQHPRIKKAVIEAIDKYGLGAGTAPMATGTTMLHRKLEDRIAAFKGCEDSLVQPSGYATNVGVISALLNEKDVCIFDSYAHASLHDGMKLAGTNKVFFIHNDLDSLESMLKRSQKDYINRMVVVEGLYSMDGDIAPLDKIYELTKKYNAWFYVDDAHATGVLGENGRGTVELYGLEGKIDILTGTFSKAIGGVGGFVAGKKDLINFIRFSSRSYIFSAAPFVPTMAAAYEAFNIIEDEPHLRKRLWENTHYMHGRLKELGFNIGETQTCIFPIIICDNKKVMDLTQKLQNNGFLINPIVYPAVPLDRARIRFAVTSEHSREDMDKLLHYLYNLGKEVGVI